MIAAIKGEANYYWKRVKKNPMEKCIMIVNIATIILIIGIIIAASQGVYILNNFYNPGVLVYLIGYIPIFSAAVLSLVACILGRGKGIYDRYHALNSTPITL
jgi:ABC-type multidrug transport system fused ATPase/permease subunit